MEALETPVLSRDWELAKHSVTKLRESLENNDLSEGIDREMGVDVSAINPHQRKLLAESLSDVQVRSKLWLLDHVYQYLSPTRKTFLVMGGWCGVLPWLASLTGRGRDAIWLSIDVDFNVGEVGQHAFGKAVPGLSFVCKDIYELDYEKLSHDREVVVINTICEHLSGLPRWRAALPSGLTTLVQSNNFRGCPDHINCVDSADELEKSVALSEVFFKGELPMPLFTRYMVIGRS